jgi:LPXTG-motif cell wall-anchored protein
MTGMQTSRLARVFATAAVAAVLVTVLPGVASATPHRRVVPAISGGSAPHGFVDPGSTFKNSAVFAGSTGPVEGTATFFLCGPMQPKNDRNVFPDGCTEGGAQIGDPVPVTNGMATSANFTDNTENGHAAAYCWRVEFAPASGSPYSAFTHTNSTSECVIAVLQVTIVTASTPTGGGVAPGTATHDTATITNDVMKPPSKDVKFFLCSPAEVTVGAGCVEGGTLVGTDRLSNGTAVSPTTRDTMDPGTYCWRAEYLGGFSPPDSIAPGEHTNWTTECFTVVGPKSVPTMVTLSNPTGGVPAGSAVTDSATVTGVGGTPTGTVDFFLCGPTQVTVGAGCTDGGTLVGTKELGSDGIAVSGPATNTSEAGLYCWRAEYSGDDAFAATEHTNATTECFEVLVVLPLRPATVTTLSSPTGTEAINVANLPVVLSDTAIVTGDGSMPTGSVNFFLCGPDQGTLATDAGCPAGGSQIGGPITVSAAGAATSATVALTKSGDYCWRAEYSGDTAYLPSAHTNATTECFSFTTVLAAKPIGRPPLQTLPQTGATGPSGLPMGFALLAIGLLLLRLSRREVAAVDEVIGDSAVRRGRVSWVDRRGRPRRSTGPPVRAGPLLGAHA